MTLPKPWDSVEPWIGRAFAGRVMEGRGLEDKGGIPAEQPPATAPEPEAWRDLAVVLVHYGDPEVTARCLGSLAGRETCPHRVVVVDHGPGDGLAKAVAGIHPHLTLLPDPANPGFGPGCNRGATLALAEGAQGVWFLNNDAVLTAPVLGLLAGLARRHPGVALWGTRLREGDLLRGADTQSFGSGGAPAPAVPSLPADCRVLGPRETLSGASIFLSRQAWDQLGPWPSDYFLYLEDTAWCMRAHRAGLAMAITGLEVEHVRSTTVGVRSRLAIFYGVRNQLRLHRELRPGASLQRLAKAAHLLQKRLFQGRWSLLAPTLMGLAAAFRGQTGRDPRF